MADTKISGLPSASTTDGSEVLPVVQSATTKKMAVSVIKNYVLGLANLFTRAQTIQPASAETALTVRRATAGQTEVILQIQAQDNTVLATFDKDGKLSTPALLVPGSTSGVVTIQAAATAGTYSLTLPTTDGDANQHLATDGSGSLSWVTPSASVTNGDSHDHSGGDGAQIDHGGLAGLSDDDHSIYHTDTRGDARYIKQGKHTIWVPAAAMTSRTTNGAASGTVETATNKVMLSTLDFDAATIEYAQFSIQMPISWDESTVTAQMVWKHAATTTNFGVSWGIQGIALSNDDAADASYGTAIYSNDTGGTTNDIYVSPETAAVTVGGTPAAGDWVSFQVLRKADDGTNDTMAIDAGLLGVSVFYTVNAGVD